MVGQESATPEELVKRQTNISELKRSFLETGSDTSGLTEWEKRLSASPVRSPRLDEAPMIEPLTPEDTKEDSKAANADILKHNASVPDSKPAQDSIVCITVKKVPPKVADKKTVVGYKVISVTSAMSDQVREGDETFEDASGEASSTEEKMKQKIQTLGRSYDTQSGKIVTMTTCNDDELEQFTSPELKRMAERLSTVKIIPVRVEPEILVPPAGHERGTLGAIEEAETPSPSEDREVGSTSGRVIEEKRPEAKLLQQDVPQKVFGTQEVQGDQQMSLTTPPYGSKMSPVLRGVVGHET